MLSPIILFVYNRPWHTRQTIEALKNNDLAMESELYIYADGPKKNSVDENISKVRDILKEISGFKKITIIEREENLGLAKSVIAGVSEIINQFGKAIILEDDLISSKNFLRFMNESLNTYKDDPGIFSIGGYSLPIAIPSNYPQDVYLTYRGSSWGWATWKDRWESIDWEIKHKESFLKSKCLQKDFEQCGEDLPKMLIRQFKGEIDSWAIRFAYSAHIQQKVHVAPTLSKIQNIGQDKSGTHSNKTTKYDVSLDTGTHPFVLPKKLELNPEIVKNTQLFFKKNFIKKITTKISELIR